MNPTDRKDYISRYDKTVEEFGDSPQALGWGKHGRQEVRFAALGAYTLQQPESSVLDVGCGFADLYDFLRSHGWRGRYTGIELVPSVLRLAQKRHPDLDLRELDLTEDGATLKPHDFVIASGIFNARLKTGDNHKHIEEVVAAMFRLTRVAACMDFLSSHVDFQRPASWHTEPGWALGLGCKLTRRLVLRHDYMPFEFALFLFKNDMISARNVFETETQTSSAPIS